jgi:hypothetical protein
MKISDLLNSYAVGDFSLPHDSPEVWELSRVGEIVTPEVSEYEKRSAFSSLFDLMYGSSQALLARGLDLDLRVVGCATVDYVLSFGRYMQEEYGLTLEIGQVRFMSNSADDTYPLIADIAVQLNEKF